MSISVSPVAAAVTAVQEKVNPAVAAPELKTEQPQPDPREALYARKERELAQKQMQFAQERDELKAKLAQYEQDYIPKSRVKDNTWDVLNELGADYNKLTEDMLAAPDMNDPGTKALFSKIKALEDKLTAGERQAAEQQSAQYAQALSAIKAEAGQLIDLDPKYETVKAEGMLDAVVELIETTFKTSGVLMDISEAAEQVENYLVDTYSKGAQYSKVQARLKPAPAVETADIRSSGKIEQSGKLTVSPKVTTLTNNITPASQVTVGNRSEKERMARAMAKFRGEI